LCCCAFVWLHSVVVGTCCCDVLRLLHIVVFVVHSDL